MRIAPSLILYAIVFLLVTVFIVICLFVFKRDRHTVGGKEKKEMGVPEVGV